MEKEFASSVQNKPSTTQNPPKQPQQQPTGFINYLSQVSRIIPPEKAKILNDFITGFAVPPFQSPISLSETKKRSFRNCSFSQSTFGQTIHRNCNSTWT
jgi:hypothetical protein